MAKKKVSVKPSEIDELKNQLVRALADYDNLRKRVEREKEEFQKLSAMGVVIRLLPFYDTLVAAQEHLKDSGLALAIEDFEKVLADEDVEKINAKTSTPFDESVHEAVDVSKKAKKPKGTIAEVLLTGWKIVDGPVIRYAKVRVK
jgi:molecular chaperone GrpE